MRVESSVASGLSSKMIPPFSLLSLATMTGVPFSSGCETSSQLTKKLLQSNGCICDDIKSAHNECALILHYLLMILLLILDCGLGSCQTCDRYAER